MVVDSYNVALCVYVCLFADSTRSAPRGHAYIPRRASLIAALCTPCLYLPRIIFTCEGNTVNQPTSYSVIGWLVGHGTASMSGHSDADPSQSTDYGNARSANLGSTWRSPSRRCEDVDPTALQALNIAH